jgi:hypothetical protein
VHPVWYPAISKYPTNSLAFLRYRNLGFFSFSPALPVGLPDFLSCVSTLGSFLPFPRPDDQGRLRRVRQRYIFLMPPPIPPPTRTPMQLTPRPPGPYSLTRPAAAPMHVSVPRLPCRSYASGGCPCLRWRRPLQVWLPLLEMVFRLGRHGSRRSAAAYYEPT